MKPIIIAEACCNHMGNIKIAKKMIKNAKKNGADYIKFQKRCISEWVEHKPEVYLKPHINPKNSFGKTYKEHREKLEFTYEQHKQLKEYCENIGIEYCCSVFDVTSAKEIVALNPKLIKIPSACNLNFDLLDFLCKNYYGEIHISFGMTQRCNIKKIIDYFIKQKRNKDLVIYLCTSNYPLKPDDVCLNEITYLFNKYGNYVKAIGYSGHHLGINIDIAAYALGASFLERHFTLNKKYKGTDQEASITPKELYNLANNLDEVSKCLKYKSDDILECEKANEEKLKW